MVYGSSDDPENIALPAPRALMSVGLMGNPPVNIIVYGGRTVVDGVSVLLNDMWSFSVHSNTWR